MTINLINQETYDRLLNVQSTYPVLTLQNKGYETLDKSKFTEEDKQAFDEVTSILKKAIVDLSEFNNFCHSKGRLRVRFQYRWDVNFWGVGYLFVDELLNGFENL